MSDMLDLWKITKLHFTTLFVNKTSEMRYGEANILFYLTLTCIGCAFYAHLDLLRCITFSFLHLHVCTAHECLKNLIGNKFHFKLIV